MTDCDGAELTVDINEGETVTLTQALRFLYEASEEPQSSRAVGFAPGSGDA